MEQALHQLVDIISRAWPWLTTDKEASAMLTGLLFGFFAGWIVHKFFHNRKIDGLSGEIRVLEREKDDLKRQKADLESKIKTLPEPKPAALDPEEQRILALAQFDKTKIWWAIRVDSCRMETYLDAIPARVHFRFPVFNGSVYPVSINRVKGFIQYGDRRLTGNIDLSTKWKVENLTPRYVDDVEIIQSLSKEEKEILQQDWSKQSFKTYFTFEQLRLIVSDAEGADRIIPKPLTLISGVALNGAVK